MEEAPFSKWDWELCPESHAKKPSIFNCSSKSKRKHPQGSPTHMCSSSCLYQEATWAHVTSWVVSIPARLLSLRSKLNIPTCLSLLQTVSAITLKTGNVDTILVTFPDMWIFPTPPSNFLTPAGHPTIQLNSTFSTWRQHQIPQVEGSVLQDRTIHPWPHEWQAQTVTCEWDGYKSPRFLWPLYGFNYTPTELPATILFLDSWFTVRGCNSGTAR